jgi:phage-related minor tail protein
MNTNAKKLLLSLGAAAASSGVARRLSRVEADDLFGLLGLERRRSHALGALGFLGLGAAVGAGVALLIAPSAGRETRAKLGKEIGKLGEVATEAAREARAGAPALVARLSGTGDETSSQPNASTG